MLKLFLFTISRIVRSLSQFLFELLKFIIKIILLVRVERVQ